MLDLSDSLALVTGSSRGIGRACALKLAAAGADVIVNYVSSRAAAEQTAREVHAFGRRTAIVKADVSEADDVQSLMEFVQTEFGTLDILVSNAATGGFRPLTATSAHHFEAAMRVNVQALMMLVQAALPLLERQAGRAKVIALSSGGAQRTMPNYGLIGSTKAALESMVRHFAQELGGRGINFNIVRAGLVETDSFRLMPGRERIREVTRLRNLVGERPLLPDDVANLVTFLASPESDLIQGQTLVIDAGYEIQL